MKRDILEHASETVRAAWPQCNPVCGLILGSGWSDVAEAFSIRETMNYDEIPGLGAAGVAGHAGRLCWAEYAGIETLIFQGRRHWYEGVGWTPVALPVFMLNSLGAESVILTNAAGGIREDLHPGDLMIIDDHINNMPENPLAGPHDDFWGLRFADQSTVYDRSLTAKIEAAAMALGQHISRGVYLASSGPTYETPAEVRAFRAWGADAVGMSTVPEAMLANAAGLNVAGISCITNYAAGISKEPLTHEEVTETTAKAMPKMKELLLTFWKELADG
ncbi:MAG: purine-nucleoside phosphorylase [Verrucomicrobia bacterium]|nr:purine-nucleoside phosphorylase [Verrucomicrobiota bacterium]